MAKSIRANLELASISDIRHIMAIDAPLVTSFPSEFSEENLLTYYVATNTWLHLVKQWSEYGWIYLANRIKTQGLFLTIREFSDAADQIVHGNDISSATVRMIRHDIESSVPLVGIPTSDTRTFHVNPMSAMLLVCRYLKRFTPIHADKLRDSSIKEFRANQRRVQYGQRRGYPLLIENLVKEELAQMLNWDRLCDELEAVSPEDVVFTPGVSFDTDALLVSKLSRYAVDHVEYLPMPFGIPWVSQEEAYMSFPTEYWGSNHQFERHDVRLLAVPKNYKTARVIAPEDVYRQALARRYFIICDRFLPGEINLHDQTQNQRFALEGSLRGNIATIDLHAASDSISKLHLYLFPIRFVKLMEKVLPTHYRIDTKTYLLHSAATMGNSMTFWLESVLFAAITRAASHYASLFGCTEDVISIYGDDIECGSEVAPTVMDFLGALGFIVNESKSFWDPQHRYRESCGEEYYDGQCVSSAYYPRFPLQGVLGGKLNPVTHRDGFTGVYIDTMMAMMDLQHKLFSICMPASIIVSELIREAMPSMTTSTPDQGLQDLWDYEEKAIIRPAPANWPQDSKTKQKLVDHAYDRVKHLTPVVRYRVHTTFTPAYQRRLVTLFKYQRFLRSGPEYDSPLDELLGVTKRPLGWAEAAGTPEIIWVPLG